MTQTTTTSTSTKYTAAQSPVTISTLTDNGILVGVWSTPITVSDESVLTVTPGAGGSVTIQFSKDAGNTWANSAGSPFIAAFAGGIPAGVNLLRATATVATGTISVSTPYASTGVSVNFAGTLVGATGNPIQLDYTAQRVGASLEQPGRMLTGVVRRYGKLACNFAAMTPTAVTFTAGLLATATSGTLTGNWAAASGIYSVAFSNGDVRLVTLTNGATTATWTTGLTAAATTAASTSTGQWSINGGTPTLTQGYTGWDGTGVKSGVVSRTGQPSMLRVNPGSNSAEDLNLGSFSTNMLTKTLAGKIGLWVYVENLPGFAAPVPLNFTASLATSATSGTLAAAWGGTTGGYSVTFSNADTRTVTLTNGATTATWSGGLTAAATAFAVVALQSLAGSIELTVSTNGASNANALLIGWNSNQVREGWNFLKFIMRDPNAYLQGNAAVEYHPGGVTCSSFGTGVDTNILTTDAARLKIGWTNMSGATLYFDSIWTAWDHQAQFVLGNDAGAGLTEYAFPLFQSYDWVGYTAFPYRVWSPSLGSRTIADLNSNLNLTAKFLYDAGWDTTNHTANHLANGTLISEAELAYEFETAREWQYSLGMVRGVEFYCSPQSSTSRLAEAVVNRMGFKLQRNGRKWNTSVTSFGLDNPQNLGSIDMGASSGFGVASITGGTGGSIAGFQVASKIKRVIDIIEAYGDACFLFWHGITTTGDSGSGEDLTGDPLLLTRSAFEISMAYIRTKQLLGTVKVPRGISEFYYGS